MGGVDKGLELLDGLPLVQHALHRLAPQVGRILISANRNLDAYARFGYPVCIDSDTSFAGPLAGFLAGLEKCETDWLAAVPCDTPRFPGDLVARLASGVDGGALAVAVTRSQDLRQRQPVFCLMRRDLRDALDSFLREGGRKIEIWLERIGCAEVAFEDSGAFFNANTLEELRQLGKA